MIYDKLNRVTTKNTLAVAVHFSVQQTINTPYK